MIDAAAQEYDLRTGRLLRSWDALDHIPPSDSYATIPTNGFPWDAYHVNAVQALGNGTFLVSMRDTWAAYLVNIRTGAHHLDAGRPPLELHARPQGGLPVAARRHAAARQRRHDVRRPLLPAHQRGHLRVGERALARAHAEARPARAHGDARDRLRRGPRIDSDYMGDEQPLPNGNVMVGWGSTPYISEYTRSGTQLFGAVLPGEDLTYRALVEPWVGLPLTAPARRRAHRRRRDDGLRELERRHRRSPPGGSSPGAAPTALWRSWRAPSARASRPRSRSPAPTRPSRCARSTRAGRVLGTSKPFAAGA